MSGNVTSPEQPVAIHWFRNDLRLEDNSALLAAAASGQLLPVYILDPEEASMLRGSASGWWLHHSLAALNRQLQGRLQFFCGDATQLIPRLMRRYCAGAVHFNRCYSGWRIAQDQQIEELLNSLGLSIKCSNDSLLWAPEQLRKDDGQPYRVFSPFFRNALNNLPPPHHPLPRPQVLNCVEPADSDALSLDELQLLGVHNWHNKLLQHWDVGAKGAMAQLENFIRSGLTNYKEGRDYPAQPHVSRLGASLHFGEISPRQLWHCGDNQQIPSEDLHHFRRQLGWREFSYNLLLSNPRLALDNLNPKFDGFAWRSDYEKLQLWQQGKTGYPIVDAGMRELWQTGYMHNRVRMVVGSFLVKNLLLHWHHGERWFRQCLVDYDPANNAASWQWIAGCGTDAAPYFRVFNPLLQGQKFDGAGVYTRRFVPELANLPDKYLFCPWQAPDALLSQCGVQLGKNYPLPIVDLKASRLRALAAYSALKQSSSAYPNQR